MSITNLVGLQILKFAMVFKRNIKFALLFISFFISCKRKEISIDDTYFGTKTIILGHRGMGVNYYKQTNTFESIYPLVGIGADGSEFDVQLTKDSVLVLYHNSNLEDHTRCFGKICNYTWDEIRTCKYNLIQQDSYINSIDDLFSRLPNLNQYYFSFDCKVDADTNDYLAYQHRFINAIKDVCEKYNMTDNVFVEGDFNFLQKAQELKLKNKLFMISNLSESSIIEASNNGFFGITTDIGNIDNNVTFAHSNGLRVMSWSPNNYTQNKYAISKMIDIVQTDDPISMLKYLERYNYEYIIP